MATNFFDESPTMAFLGGDSKPAEAPKTTTPNKPKSAPKTDTQSSPVRPQFAARKLGRSSNIMVKTTPELHASLKDLAKENLTSVNEVINVVLSDFVANQK